MFSYRYHFIILTSSNFFILVLKTFIGGQILSKIIFMNILVERASRDLRIPKPVPDYAAFANHSSFEPKLNEKLMPS